VAGEDAPAARGLPFPVVGIGASAGGLEAVSAMLRELPPDSGMAFILVQHLDPHHESQLVELLTPIAKMPVQTATDRTAVKPNHFYVIPPKGDLVLRVGRLRLLPRKPGLHLPVDTFFESLATAQGSRAIGIILSGNASDGSQGIRAIKGNYGLTFVQEESSAGFAGMPRNAIATGAVDFVLPPADIARELVRIARHPFVVPPPEEADREVLPEGEVEIRRIFAILHSANKVDFSHYKQNTIRRRIGRRMIVNRTGSLAEYAHLLEKTPAEVRELYKDLLISVTNFFRDPAAFAALSKLMNEKIRSRRAEEPLRIWVPGCATGEEVYSLGILMSEILEDLRLTTPLQLFGTDISDPALDRARGGLYPQSIAEDITADRLRRFFARSEGGYQVNRAIRESCVFARQDLTKDPPFAHTDLITCRNVLIYMDSALQRRILPVFHYSLNAEGLMMLGTAETVAGTPDLFEPIDKQHHIYRRRSVPVRLTLDLALGRHAAEMREVVPGRSPMSGPELIKKIDRVIQSKYSPAAVVVDSDLQILHFRGHTSFYLEPSPGDANLSLLRMAREGLVVALRRNIEQAADRNISIRETGLYLEHNGDHRQVAIEVTPIAGALPSERYFLVVFEDVPQPEIKHVPVPDLKDLDAEEYLAQIETEKRQFQQQLAETREYLRNLNEDHEASEEELRAANEEVRSANEELQSTNEELGTTKEELQSANEELTTVNEELQNRNHELDGVNNDLSNLLAAVSIPILMVDSSLRLRRFNSAAERLLEIGAVDIGHLVFHLTARMEVPELEGLVHTVLETLVTQQREVQDKSGHWYSLSVRPYRTADNRIDGAVLVFVDIDPLKRSLTVAEEARDYAEGMIETVREPLVVLDSDLRVQRATSAFYDTFHVSRGETAGRHFYDLGNGQWNQPRLRELLGDALFRNQPFQDFEIEHDFPHIGRRTMRLNARRIPRETDESYRAILLSIEDVTGRREQAEIRYQRLFETAKDGILVLNSETQRLTDVNPYFLELTGYAREDFVGKKLKETPAFCDVADPLDVVAATRAQEAVRYDALPIRSRRGQEIEAELLCNRYTIGSQEVVQINARDITERRHAGRERSKAEEALRQANQQLQRANSDLEEFAYAVSHDLQEPLRTIALYAELLQQRSGEKLDPDAGQFLTYINQAVLRLRALINDLTSYTRATAPFDQPTSGIEAGAVLEAAMANLKSTIDENQASITHGILPTVRMHSSHLLEVFQNLISNAVKYRRSESPHISVTAASRPDEYLFSIQDDGLGIAPEALRSVFRMFNRLHTREREGTGIGLAICQKIVENYGGRIWVESVVGKGSTFFFSIPK